MYHSTAFRVKTGFRGWFSSVENMAIATEQKARRSLLETNDAAEFSREMIGRLQSLGPVLAARQRKVTNTIHVSSAVGTYPATEFNSSRRSKGLHCFA
jgi:hypothetical protein